MKDEGFKSACLLQGFHLFADMADQIQIEILRHDSDEHEYHVFCQEGKWQMRPSEVVVLYVKVLFTLSPCIVEYDDVFLGGKPAGVGWHPAPDTW